MLWAIFLTLLFFSSLHLHATEITGTVVSVADGDTIAIVDAHKQQHRIRLARIDAPERRQAYGTKSKQFLASLIYRQDVKIEYHKRDKYGRILGVVFLGASEINLLMVQQGMAWHYSYYDNTERYIVAEREARQQKIGLWADPTPIQPYIYRRDKRQKRQK